MDRLLKSFYNLAIEEGIEYGVWLSVPGGIVTGDLASRTGFLDALEVFPWFTNDFRSKIEAAREEKDVGDHDEDVSVESINLINVSLVMPNQLISLPFARIAIDHVGAWGIGRMEDTNA